MIQKLLAITFIFFLSIMPLLAYESLQDVYNEASGNGQYDKYIELNPDIEYLGDLRISAGHNVFLDGHGARIYAEGDNFINIGISLSTLDIQNCVIIGGLGGIYLSVQAAGTIKNVTITGCREAGIRTYAVGSANNIAIYDNIMTDCLYGFFCNEEEHPQYLGQNTIYGMVSYRYAEFCPG